MNKSLGVNQLKNQTSIYLKSHADQKIHWWPWGPEALMHAKENNLPIFLSIGYSSCHWCHEMSRVTFKNDDIANFLNEHFVSIKVDREEFPDIDSYFQEGAKLFLKNGGWPLSVFMLNDLRPFYIGTYFPPYSEKNQSPGFLELIKELSRAYREDADSIKANAEKVFQAINQGPIVAERVQFEGHFPSPHAILEATKEFHDLENGGFKSAPKFPQFSFYEWAIEQMLEGMIQKEHGEFIIKTIEKMLCGGLYDHARGGMHRYSTDEKWLVPHFEKMLYDQAGLLKLLTKTSLLYPAPLIYDAIIDTLDYLEQEMLSEDGYFFSAQDSVSEGVEGLYHTFTYEEFEDAINQYDNENEELSKELEEIKKWFNISKEGNFQNKLNIINLDYDQRESLYREDKWNTIRKTKKAILIERARRLPPVTDTKGIASWNFMLLSALTDVIQYNQIDFIKRKASQLLANILEKNISTFLIIENDKMRLRHVTGHEHTHPYLEDFVTFSETQLRMYEISANPIFKQNFKDTLEFITKEFLEEDKLLTRAKFATNFEQYPNHEYTVFDNSFKSVVATYLLMMKKAALLFKDLDYLEEVSKLEDRMGQIVLRYNPIGAGEALRVLTYPNEAYKVLEVPATWAQNEEFMKLTSYFLSRFVISYTDETDIWQICNLKSCELKGIGIEEFKKLLLPKES